VGCEDTPAHFKGEQMKKITIFIITIMITIIGITQITQLKANSYGYEIPSTDKLLYDSGFITIQPRVNYNHRLPKNEFKYLSTDYVITLDVYIPSDFYDMYSPINATFVFSKEQQRIAYEYYEHTSFLYCEYAMEQWVNIVGTFNVVYSYYDYYNYFDEEDYLYIPFGNFNDFPMYDYSFDIKWRVYDNVPEPNMTNDKGALYRALFTFLAFFIPEQVVAEYGGIISLVIMILIVVSLISFIIWLFKLFRIRKNR
jgi:hypothetical protein